MPRGLGCLGSSKSNFDVANKAAFCPADDCRAKTNKLIAETQRAIDDLNFSVFVSKKEVDNRLKERTDELTTILHELEKCKRSTEIEEEALKSARFRLEMAISIIEIKLKICRNCISLRSHYHLDKVSDDVDKNLKAEEDIVSKFNNSANKLHREINEHIHLLKIQINQLISDISRKEKALEIDVKNRWLKVNSKFKENTSAGLSEQCKLSWAQWKKDAQETMEKTAKEQIASCKLRTYVDALLKQATEDIRTQTVKTNYAFTARSNEMKTMKGRLERMYMDTNEGIGDIKNTILHLEKELKQKERLLAHARTRLANRKLRPTPESTCDEAHESLLKELKILDQGINIINSKLIECRKTLRYLKATKAAQEEEMYGKGNNLKVDELNCMTIRDVLLRHPIF